MKIDRSLSPGENRPQRPQRGARLFAFLGFGLAMAIFAGTNPATIKAARAPQLKSSPLPASAPKLSDHEIEALPSMSAQQQAQLLMERAINHYEGEIELIDKN